MVLHQQQHARELPRLHAQALQPDLGANERLDAALAPFLVELDGAKQVAQVGNGQRRLAVGSGRLDHLVDAGGAINDGKFGVQA